MLIYDFSGIGHRKVGCLGLKNQTDGGKSRVLWTSWTRSSLHRQIHSSRQEGGPRGKKLDLGLMGAFLALLLELLLVWLLGCLVAWFKVGCLVASFSLQPLCLFWGGDETVPPPPCEDELGRTVMDVALATNDEERGLRGRILFFSSSKRGKSIEDTCRSHSSIELLTSGGFMLTRVITSPSYLSNVSFI